MKKQILRSFELVEISGVDRPAQPTAVVSIIKRRTDTAPTDTVVSFIKAYCSKNLHQAQTFTATLRAEKINSQMWPMTDALHTAIREISKNGALSEAEMMQAIAVSVSEFSGKLLDELAVIDNPLVKFVKAVATGNTTEPNNEDDLMKTELEKLAEEIKVLKASGVKAAADLATALIVAKLSDGEKDFMAEMDDDAKKAFTGLSGDERKAKMDLKKANDETIVVGGSTISKLAVGASMFEVVKAQQADLDAQKADVKKAREETAMAVFTKRAGDDFSHLTGTPAELADVLKAIADMPEAVKKTAEAVFKSAEELAKKAFVTSGMRKGFEGTEGSAAEQLDTLAKAHAEDNKVGYAVAYSAVIEKRTDLYELSLSEAQ